ncbi:MAG: Gfo/Idh/MocA family oxidoreductase [Bacteroidales bacterium]
MSKVMRAGLIGSGFAAKFHFEALKRVTVANIEVTGVYSPTPEKLKAFTTARKLTECSSAGEVIRNADIIHVCTPPSTHENLVIESLEAGKHVIVEKPLTGYFGDGSESFNGDTFSREKGLMMTIDSLKRMKEAEARSTGRIMYAENWIYAPSIQKEREVIEKSGAQILRMLAEESHSGSHSPTYGIWKYSGGGSLIGKSCHPLSGAIYFKYAEGRARDGKPIRPVSVSARTHAITRMPGFKNLGHLKSSYTDIEDYGIMHIVFQDGTFADIIASELVMGGVHNRIEVFANNHRTVCNMHPNNAMQTYTPDEKYFSDIYVVEKTETKQGWSFMSPDEAWFAGYQHEMEAFYRSAVNGERVESDSSLACDVIATIYAGYLSSERKGAEVEIPLI